ncbi:hypothetical protein DEO72_LG1g3173 [Vigna unguiculata]|uniref:Uncharacterized protein n=1 Tax=Vigna unguiculata TaxID=3917 RepID=A0A4D6KY26_VIGUN|nr:hypothetical protein DEO72_LG1g3173 [Vigna unguiculata]
MPISNQPTNNSCFPFHTQHSKQATTSENQLELEHETCPSLTQARSPHSSERSSLAQASPSRLGESSNSGTVASAISCLGETSSPKRYCSSLKTKARRLSDNSSRKPGRASTSLA